MIYKLISLKSLELVVAYCSKQNDSWSTRSQIFAALIFFEILFNIIQHSWAEMSTSVHWKKWGKMTSY